MDTAHKRLARGSARTVLAFGAALLLAFAGLCQCRVAHAQDAPPRRILMLNGYNYMQPAPTTLSDALRNRFLERAPRKIEIDAEFLDLARTRDPEHESRMVSYLRERYARARPDLVITIGRDALLFAIKHRSEFAPGTPIVFASVPVEIILSLSRPADVTGITTAFDLNFAKTLDLAERLQPDARRLIVVAGNSGMDLTWQSIAPRVVESRTRKLETTYLFGRSFDELAAELSRAPRDAIVILLTIYSDSTGKSFIPVEAVVTLAAHSTAPTYTPYFNPIGRGGLVGGSGETMNQSVALPRTWRLRFLAARIRPQFHPLQVPRLTAQTSRPCSNSA